MIIVSITGPRMSDALEQVASSEMWADMFEFRFDLIRKPELAILLLSTRKPVIATCRPRWEGGEFRGTEGERLEILAAASLLGAEYVDIELAAGRAALSQFLGRRKESGVIVSCHLPPGARASGAAVYRKMKRTGADVFKFAYHARDAWENRAAFDFMAAARSDGRKAIAIAMGAAGEPSRVLYRVYGGWGTYASAESGKGSAPGQIPGRVLRELYRSEHLDRSTKVFGVVGHPVAQSRGIYVHNPLFARAEKNSVYCRFDVADLRKFFARIVPLIDGFSVTHPHKVMIGEFLDAIDPVARAIGAVNTVIRRRGRLTGINTDAGAALDAIEHGAPVKGKRMLILGAGGAARAIGWEASRRGAVVVVTGRNSRAVRGLSREFGFETLAYRSMADAEADVLVNATPVGMAPHAHETPFPRAMLRGRTVFDAVYNPPVTRLLREAAASGAEVVRGTDMYINQAATQFALYAGVAADIPVMKKLLLGEEQ